MSKDLSLYVTTKQAAEIMGVAPDHVNRLLIGGKLRGQKLGHYWLVYVPSIEKYDSTKAPGGRPRSKETKATEPN